MLRLDTRRRRSTGSLKIEVSTAWPSHSTSRGSPTFSDTTFKRPSLRVRGPNSGFTVAAGAARHQAPGTRAPRIRPDGRRPGRSPLSSCVSLPDSARALRREWKPDRSALQIPIRGDAPMSRLPLFTAVMLALGVPASAQQPAVLHKAVKIGDLDIFYRESGPKDAPAILLLHGFPTSSQMFRNLIPALGDKYHVVAPDYPGYGHSSMPAHDRFAYTFDNLAKVIDEFTEELGLARYALYVQDYGAPVGYRLAVKHPERITAIVVQNGNAYDEGLDNEFWKPIKAYWREPKSQEKRDAIRNLLTYDATRWQYTTGVKNPELVSPDGAAQDQFLLDRKGNDEIQLDLFLSYGSNPPLYPKG